MMTEVCGATSCIMMEVGGATNSMMKVHGATKSNSRNYIRQGFIQDFQFGGGEMLCVG